MSLFVATRDRCCVGYAPDVVFHVVCYLCLVAILFAATVVGARGRRAVQLTLAVASVIVLGASAYLLDDPRWVLVVPSPEAWLWTNLALPGSAVLAAVAFRAASIRWQGVLLAVVMLVFGAYRSLGPLVSPAPALGPPRWVADGRVCRQSTPATCGPAAVASALAAVGVATDEAAMSRAGLTSRSGTSTLGIYRAIRVGLAGADPQFAVRYHGGSEATLASFPAVVSIEPPDVRASAGLLPLGARHAVAVLARDLSGDLVVADPYAGLQRWPRGTLDRLRARGGAFFVIVPSGAVAQPGASSRAAHAPRG